MPVSFLTRPKQASCDRYWPDDIDPFLALENLDDPAVLAWVDKQNIRTRGTWCAGTKFTTLAERLAHAYLPHDRPVIPQRWKDWAYDYWENDHQPKGLWRRTSWTNWRNRTPQWQSLLDFDALAVQEDMPWVCAGIEILYPDGDRALITLSPGGTDAVIVREFDIEQRVFVRDGFVIEMVGKHTVTWIDRDTVYVGWDVSTVALTRSGYPREIRRWQRGTQLSDAPIVFCGEFDDITVQAQYDPINARHEVTRNVDFCDSHTYWLDEQSKWQRYDVPSHVTVETWNGWLLLKPQENWDYNGIRYAEGSLLAIRENIFLTGKHKFTLLFTPTPMTSVCEWTHTRHYLIVSWLDDMHSRTMLWLPQLSNAVNDDSWTWQSRPFPTRVHDFSQINILPVADMLNDEVYITVCDYLLPPEYGLINLTAEDLSSWELFERWPTQFNAASLTIIHSYATSKDGTKIPYTIVCPCNSLDEPTRMPRPCLLTGYGGFAIPLTKHYLVGPGISWLEKGGIFVIAHVRGGGEYGTAWHIAAQRIQRQCSFDDFIAVAEQLVANGVTIPTQLGIQGSSNGGLLVAACMIQRPNLFGAVVCEVPLLDMQRYPLLHAGASWLDEYGDPNDPKEACALASWSPYHNVQANVTYPPILFTTSKNDDRVHPSHARKMVARMQAQKHTNVWYLENTEGGHSSGNNVLEWAQHDALIYCFLWATLSQDAMYP